MKIAPTVGVLLHSRRARGAILKFLSPAAKLALALGAGLALYRLVIFGLRWAGYDPDNVLLIALLAVTLYQRIKEEMDLDRVRTATDGSAHGQSS